MKDKRLERLGGVLESLKARDAARLELARAALRAHDARSAAIEAEIAATRAALDPRDLHAAAAYHPWRAAQLSRLAALAERRHALEAHETAMREALLRSNGEVEALKRLADAAKPKRR